MPLDSLTFPAAVGVLVFIGGLLTTCGKELIDSIKYCYSIERTVIIAILNSSKSLIQLASSVVIDHDSFKAELSRRFRFGVRCGGVSILGSPAGSGKSTYLSRYIPLLAQENRVGFIFLKADADFLSQRGLHDHLGIPKNKKISDYIPKGTIIVLDQCDIKHRHIKPEMEQYVIDIATDSSNTLSFHVIVCVSDSDVFADMVMHYNNGQKISQLCLPSAVKWTHDQIKRYISVSLPDWSLDDLEKFTALLSDVKSPGPVWHALQLIELDGLRCYDDLDDDIRAQICINVTTLATSWKDFDIVERTLLGDSELVGSD